MHRLLFTANAGKNFFAFVLAAAGETAFLHTEDSPHARFYIPLETAGAVEIIAGTGGTVFQFYIVGVANTYGTL